MIQSSEISWVSCPAVFNKEIKAEIWSCSESPALNCMWMKSHHRFRYQITNLTTAVSPNITKQKRVISEISKFYVLVCVGVCVLLCEDPLTIDLWLKPLHPARVFIPGSRIRSDQLLPRISFHKKTQTLVMQVIKIYLQSVSKRLHMFLSCGFVVWYKFSSWVVLLTPESKNPATSSSALPVQCTSRSLKIIVKHLAAVNLHTILKSEPGFCHSEPRTLHSRSGISLCVARWLWAETEP